MPSFSPEDINRSISNEARLAIADLIMAWATFDMMVSYWILTAFGMPLDTESILLGNMDVKSKLNRLKLGFAHHNNKKSAASVGRLEKAHSEFVETRNIVAHRGCVGCLKSDNERLVFSSVKRVHGEVGQFEVIHLHLTQIQAATQFATHAHQSIFAITGPHEVQTSHA